LKKKRKSNRTYDWRRKKPVHQPDHRRVAPDKIQKQINKQTSKPLLLGKKEKRKEKQKFSPGRTRVQRDERLQGGNQTRGKALHVEWKKKRGEKIKGGEKGKSLSVGRGIVYRPRHQ